MDCGFDWLRLFWRPATPSVIKRDFWGEVSSQHSSASVRGDSALGRVSIGWPLRESPNLALLTKAHLAQLIDSGVGGRTKSRIVSWTTLSPPPPPETRATTPITNDANQLICAGAGRERGDARGASSRGRLPDNDVRPYWELAKMKPTGFVTPGRISPHNLASAIGDGYRREYVTNPIPV